MRIAADTNLLVRVIIGDEPSQARLAEEALLGAELVALSTTTLCEFAWVAAKRYRLARSDIARAIRTLAAADNAVVDRAAVNAGLAVLDLGGDFADGVIAYEGRQLGGVTFVSFDRTAVRLIGQAADARLLH